MLDLILISLGLGFFAAAVAYAYACDRRYEETSMIFDYWLAGLVTAGLLAYLTYALIRPEKF
jgi:K+-transporting ATPase ATPase F chain